MQKRKRTCIFQCRSALILASAVLFFADHAVIVAQIGWAEFTYGKCHIIEYSARVILISNDAFLIGNCIFGGIDKILRGTNYAYYREDADSNH